MPALLFFIPVGVLLLWYWRQGQEGGAVAAYDFAAIDREAPAVPETPSSGVLWFLEGADLGEALAPLPAAPIEFAIASAIAPRASWLPAARASSYTEHISRAEQTYGVPANLLARLIQEESNFNPSAIGPMTYTGERAVGIAQFMPATARDLGVDPLNPIASINAAGRYLKQLFDATGSWAQALAAYNWGIGNVQRRGLGAAPAQTRRYVARILSDVPT